MVSFKKLCLVGAAILGAVSAIPTPASGDVSLSARELSAEARDATLANVVRDSTSEDGFAKRARGRMSLQWSPQGRIFFCLGAGFPQAVIDSLYTLGEGGPGKALLDNFRQWLLSNAGSHGRAFTLFNQATKGGIYGKAGGAIENDFGFGLQTANFPTAGDLQDLLNAVNAWAGQAGNLVQVLARPNNFFDMSTIGAGQKRDLESRSRGNTCPASMNLLQYATQDVATDVDINNDFRWAGTCN